MVYAKPPFGGPDPVHAYLGRYTHRVAISNSRLVSLTDGRVAFRWKDYRHHGKAKVMTLDPDEFIRRFLLHSLPDGFHRIRHYGFLANGHRAENSALCLKLLAVASPSEPATPAQDHRERHRCKTAMPLHLCPCCGGAMVTLDTLAPSPPSRGPRCRPSFWNSS